MHMLKKVCYMTTSFPAIYFFYDSVIISREHLKRCICQGHFVYFTTLFAAIHYDKRSVLDSRKCLFGENYGNFCLKSTVLNVRDPILSFFDLTISQQ